MSPERAGIASQPRPNVQLRNVLAGDGRQLALSPFCSSARFLQDAEIRGERMSDDFGTVNIKRGESRP